ncbi:hypothetical protein L2E82_42169 [Cichorium intybus]|uniref:Uncharacterized protein n=1 Tax=Cichorium intybus TaxID=13427 RepID=A0ACB8ZKP1_CICIN|nr:hypothetical protein L2E82_42169 [Cichorium intybus]
MRNENPEYVHNGNHPQEGLRRNNNPLNGGICDHRSSAEVVTSTGRTTQHLPPPPIPPSPVKNLVPLKKDSEDDDIITDNEKDPSRPTYSVNHDVEGVKTVEQQSMSEDEASNIKESVINNLEKEKVFNRLTEAGGSSINGGTYGPNWAMSIVSSITSQQWGTEDLLVILNIL